MSVRLFHADCYTLLPQLDLSGYSNIAIVTDPPYEVQEGGSKKAYFKSIHEQGITSGFDFRIFELVDAKNVISFCSKAQRHKLESWLLDRFHRVEELRWNKLNPPPFFNRCYLSDYEPWLHAWQHGHAPNGDFGDLHTHIATKVGGHSGYDHPTVKPLAVMKKAMKPLRADLIIDPFMGTGTTGVIAQQMGIDFIGIERVERFFKIASERLKMTFANSVVCGQKSGELML